MMVVSAKSALPSARPAQISQPVSPATLLPPASINISAKAGVTHPARTPSSATPLLFAEVATSASPENNCKEVPTEVVVKVTDLSA